MEPAKAPLVFRWMKPRGEILNRPVVLLVEDEPLVRLTQVDILQARQEINVVLTDVDMPGSIDGFEFARLVRQGWPEVAVLVISGKTSPGPGDLPQGAHFLHKPVRSATL